MVFYSTSEGSIGLAKALDEALSGLDHKLAIEHDAAAEQHAVAHRFPAGQGEVHRPALVTEHQVGANHVALLQLTIGTPEPPETDQSGFAFKDRKSTRLNSSHVKISYA